MWKTAKPHPARGLVGHLLRPVFTTMTRVSDHKAASRPTEIKRLAPPAAVKRNVELYISINVLSRLLMFSVLWRFHVDQIASSTRRHARGYHVKQPSLLFWPRRFNAWNP